MRVVYLPRGSALPNPRSRASLACRASLVAGDGRRRRESLLDNVEPAADGSSEHPETGRRRRRRRQQSSAEDDEAQSWATAAAEAGSPSVASSAWQESEWGPAEAPPATEETAWGWDDATWQQPAGGAADSAQRAAASRAAGSPQERRGSGPGNGAFSGPAAGEPDRYVDGNVEEDAGYDEEGDDDDYGNGGYASGLPEPDIALLSEQELERVLPVVPFSAQAAFFNGSAAQAVQRWGASLALTVLLSKAALLAATSLTWPLWWPWAQAATKNYGLRKQASCAGLWRTRVLEVEDRGRPRPQFSRGGGGDDGEEAVPPRSRFSTMRTTRIVLGDPGGAQTELVLPHDARYELMEPGQAAELVVLSSSPSFESFKAVKDVYLPECGLWLSEYPYLDRTQFLEVSLDIERESARWEREATEPGGEPGSRQGAENSEPPWGS